MSLATAQRRQAPAQQQQLQQDQHHAQRGQPEDQAAPEHRVLAFELVLGLRHHEGELHRLLLGRVQRHAIRVVIDAAHARIDGTDELGLPRLQPLQEGEIASDRRGRFQLGAVLAQRQRIQARTRLGEARVRRRIGQQHLAGAADFGAGKVGDDVVLQAVLQFLQ